MTEPVRGQADYLALGDWNAACAQCGRKRKASEMMKLPKGVPGGDMYVCPEHWDFRQPQDYVRGIPDKMAAPWSQPQNDIFTEYCTTVSGVADYAIADCALCDYYTIPDEGTV